VATVKIAVGIGITGCVVAATTAAGGTVTVIVCCDILDVENDAT
jgi:hypothetical protein